MRLLDSFITFVLLLPCVLMAQVQDTVNGLADRGVNGAAYGAGWWWFWFVLLLVIVGLAIWWVTSTGARKPGGPAGTGTGTGPRA